MVDPMGLTAQGDARFHRDLAASSATDGARAGAAMNMSRHRFEVTPRTAPKVKVSAAWQLMDKDE
ncbi:MAG: hypothetical protein HY791_11235 [Deltaproteobacteria bacterium]|nr:hypothetical protein [Deltaproteobacteria bacterium]